MTNIAAYLKKVSLFEDLSDRECEHIASACRRRPYRARVNLFHAGDPGGQLYIVVRGGVKIYCAPPDNNGQKTTLAILYPG